MKEIEDLIRKARRFLKTAELAMKDGDNDSCVSRAYYAMFLMAEAVLLSKSLKASFHASVITLFGEHFVKTGVFGRDVGKSLRKAYDSRKKGDYGIGFLIDREEAENKLRDAKNFVKQAEDYLRQKVEDAK